MKVIDSEEFPMDYQQFRKWWMRFGGRHSFEIKTAIEADHEAAIAMECAKQYLSRHPRKMIEPQDLLNTVMLCAKEISTRARKLRSDLDESDPRFDIFTQIMRDNERIMNESATTLALMYDGQI